MQLMRFRIIKLPSTIQVKSPHSSVLEGTMNLTEVFTLIYIFSNKFHGMNVEVLSQMNIEMTLIPLKRI